MTKSTAGEIIAEWNSAEFDAKLGKLLMAKIHKSSSHSTFLPLTY